MTLQRRLNAVVYKNIFPVAINCHIIKYLQYLIIFFFLIFVFVVLQHVFFSPTDSFFSRW